MKTVEQGKIGQFLGNNPEYIEEELKNQIDNISQKDLKKLLKLLKTEDKSFDTISGRNLGATTRHFDLMSNQNGEVTENLNNEQLELLKKVDYDYLKNYSYMQKNPKVTPMEIKDEKVVLSPGIPHHTINGMNLEVIQSISKLGFLPSENFGHLESENEGRYCAFFRKTPTSFTDTNLSTYLSIRGADIPYKENGGVSKDNINLFIDQNHPLYKLLEKNDYFEYEHIKNSSPEKLHEKYTPLQIKIFDELIEPYSSYSKNFHDDKKKGTFDWLAIPGGIPPQLVNGISLPKNFDKSKLGEYVEAMQQAFPQAVIFDYNQVVIAKPFSKGINPNYESRAKEEQSIIDKLLDNEREYRETFNSIIKSERTLDEIIQKSLNSTPNKPKSNNFQQSNKTQNNSQQNNQQQNNNHKDFATKQLEI